MKKWALVLLAMSFLTTPAFAQDDEKSPSVKILTALYEDGEINTVVQTIISNRRFTKCERPELSDVEGDPSNLATFIATYKCEGKGAAGVYKKNIIVHGMAGTNKNKKMVAIIRALEVADEE